jgi:hypothetical protein
MIKRFGLVVLALGFVLVASLTAEARPPRGGSVQSPFGEVYNTRSPEWKAAGGNILVYQQLMEQKLLLQQQQTMLKQQQQLQKQAKATAKASKTVAPATAVLPPAKKKKRSYVPTGKTATSDTDKSTVPPATSGAPMSDPLKTPATTTTPKTPGTP